MVRTTFEASIHGLHDDIIRMGSIVEKQIYSCIDALKNQDLELSEKVKRDDDIVDALQREIDEKTIKLIATQQPLAVDLRDIFTATKIVTDLERIADHAVDIAKVVKRLQGEEYIKELIDIPRMADLIRDMLKDSLDAYVAADVKRAYEICKRDDEIDAIYKQVFREFLVMMMENPKTINQATQFMFVCKYLERVADHITNICESTIYISTGEQVDLNE